MDDNQSIWTVDTSTLGDYYSIYNNDSSNPYQNTWITTQNNNIVYCNTVYTPSNKDILDKIDIKEIEQYLRNKKLEAINKK